MSGSGSTRDYKWWEVFELLHQRLVPARGRAETLQGELIRLTGKLNDEAWRNGNLNFGADHVAAWTFVASELLGSGLFTEEEKQQIKDATGSILSDPGTVPLQEWGSPYYLLSERAVDFCMATPDPVALELGGDSVDLAI